MFDLLIQWVRTLDIEVYFVTNYLEGNYYLFAARSIYSRRVIEIDIECCEDEGFNLVYVILHELAHVKLGHINYCNQSYKWEAEAEAFALMFMANLQDWQYNQDIEYITKRRDDWFNQAIIHKEGKPNIERAYAEANRMCSEFRDYVMSIE